jgi:hypothetical protein
VSTFPTTTPIAIRAALAARLVAIRPTLDVRQDARWTYLPDREIAGTLRSFNLMFRAQTEVGNGDFASPVELIVSYPVGRWDIEIFMGTDAQDLSAVLVNLHETVTGMFPQTWSQDRRVVPTYTGSDGNYIGTHSFTVEFFAVDSVAVAS